MFTATTVSAPIDFKRLYISVMLFCFCPDMMQSPSIMTDIIMLIFKYHAFHVVILSDVLLISLRLSFLMILKLDVTGDPVLFQIQQIFFTAVTAVSRSIFRKFPKCSFMFFKYRDQRIIIRAVVADITVNDKVVFYRNLYIVSRFELAIQHMVLFHLFWNNCFDLFP